jgi:UDP-glucose 4-epimerase
MRVFVSGVAGLLGGHIAREGRALGWRVTGLDNLLGGDESNIPGGVTWLREDCQQTGDYAWLLEGAEVVYHCAAAPYEGLSVFSPQLVFDHTLMSTVALLRASINAGVRRFVFC